MKNLLDTRTRTKYKRSESEIHIWFVVSEFLPGLKKISVKYIQKHSQAIDPPSYSTCNKCWGWLSISTRLLGCNALAGVDQSTAFMDITFSKKGGGFVLCLPRITFLLQDQMILLHQKKTTTKVLHTIAMRCNFCTSSYFLFLYHCK